MPRKSSAALKGVNMSYGNPGDRIISDEEYAALSKAVDQVAETSRELDKDVKALDELVKKCCPHRGTEKIAS